MATWLVTGGAGYIGSHTVVELLTRGDQVVVIDNLSNSSPEAIERCQRLGGSPVTFYQYDLLDRAATDQVFADHAIDGVIHFAGLKAVGESVAKPLWYYHNNLVGTVNLLEAMTAADCRRLVFSSSATVYGDPDSVPIDEQAALRTTNPYGRTKLMIEEMLYDMAAASADWHIINLRYFNPVGAHVSGAIGEDPQGIPNNLLPFIAQVAVGRRERLAVFGDDYPTPDGTGVRDYIHVVDLARGHLAALDHIDDRPGCRAYNLGTGRGYSVLEMVAAFEAASGRSIAYEITPRRPGDVATCYANAALAEQELGWRAELDVQAMCVDAWRWQSLNPRGYDSAPASLVAS